MRFEWQDCADQLDVPESTAREGIFHQKLHFRSEAQRRAFIRKVLTDGADELQHAATLPAQLGTRFWQLVNFAIAIESLSQATSQMRSVDGRETHKLEGAAARHQSISRNDQQEVGADRHLLEGGLDVLEDLGDRHVGRCVHQALRRCQFGLKRSDEVGCHAVFVLHVGDRIEASTGTEVTKATRARYKLKFKLEAVRLVKGGQGRSAGGRGQQACEP